MTIEIRQLIIRATVVEAGPPASSAHPVKADRNGTAQAAATGLGDPGSADHAALRQSIVAACTRAVLHRLERARER